MVIAIDFDGTIVDHQYPLIGAPVPEAIRWMKFFNDNNHQIILYTMRSDIYLREAVEYIEDNGVFLFGVNENPDQYSWTNSNKVYAHKYIDDAAVGCPLIQPEGFSRPCVDWNRAGRIIVGAE